MNIIQRFLVLLVALSSVLVMGAVSNTHAATTLEAGQYVIFYHNDLLGSPAVVTDHNGNTLWHEHSDPYGRARDRVSETGEEFQHDRVESRKGYTGHLKDEGSDLVYMKARFYDPQIGRFYSNDPVGFQANAPMMFNRYAYANNNPYRYVDPDGRNAVTAFGGAIYESAEGLFGVGDGRADYGNLRGALYDGYNGQGSGAWAAAGQDALEIGGAIVGGAVLGKIGSKIAGFFKRSKPSGGLPKNPNDLTKQGYTETSHPGAKKAGHRTFEKPGDKVRFDEGKPGSPGHEGTDHYHRYNPSSTGKRDQYLDKEGNPCCRGSDESHLSPED